MKQPQPSTPFSTPLSGSARQAEARIRNLFQCEKKRPPLPLLFLAALLILSCCWLVSCRSQPADPLVVMEVQHYDTNSNYLEIPTLVLPDGQKADEGLTSINRALSGLRDSYLPLLEGPLPSGTDGYDNCCLLYPAETDRYLNLLFFQTYFVSDLNTGHVLSLVYDKEERRQVSLEDALALAGVTEEGLYLALAEQYDPELAQEVPGADLCIQDPDLEGFRMGGDGQPLFYLTARSDDQEDSAADAVSGAEHLYIWSAGTFTRYNPYDLHRLPPLVPAEECLDLDPPLWRQWHFADEKPEGGFTSPALPVSPSTPRPPALTEEAEQMVLDYFTSGRFRPVSGRAWFLGDGLSPQAGDLVIQDIQPAALYPTYETLCGIYRIRYLLYGSGDRLTDPHDLEDYLFFDLDQSENFLGVRTVMSVPGGHLLTAALTDSWEGVLSDVYAALWRDGFPMPAGLWSSEISFYGEEDHPVHTVLKSWRGSDSSDSLQLEQLSWEGFTSVTYCQPEYDRRSVWYLETTDPAFYTARGIRVGSTRAEVENAYRTLQDPPFNGQEFPGVWYSSQEGRLKPAILFFFEDGLVSRIPVDFRTH